MWARLALKSSVLLLVLLMCTTLRASGRDVSTVTLSDVVEGIHNRAERFYAVGAKIAVREFHRAPDGTESDVSMSATPTRVRIEGRRLCVDRQEADRTYSFSWDGTRFLTLSNIPALGKQGQFTGLISATPGRAALQQDELLVPFEYRLFDEPRSLSMLVDTGKWEIVGKETIADYEAWHIRGSLGDKVGRVVDAWIDPFHDFAPVKVICTVMVRGIPYTASLQHVELSQVDGLWVITTAEAVVTNQFVLHDLVQVYQYRLSDYEVRTGFTDDTFAIRFPSGTNVWDDVAKQGSVVGKGEYVLRADGLTDLQPAGFVPDKQALHSPVIAVGSAAQVYSTESQRHHRTLTVVAFSVLGSGCVAAIAYLVRRRVRP